MQLRLPGIPSALYALLLDHALRRESFRTIRETADVIRAGRSDTAVLRLDAAVTAYAHRVATDLTSQQESAHALYEQKQYADALSAFTVLRKLRARQEGTDSLMYLSNTHSAVYCLRHLGRWDDALPLLEELSATRDRTLGPGDASSLDAKRWWVWACRETGNYSKASDLEIEIADALYGNGDTASAERAVATAIYYENQTSTSQPADVVAGKAAASAANGAKLKSIAKKVGGGALAAGVTAAFEGVVGGVFS